MSDRKDWMNKRKSILLGDYSNKRNMLKGKRISEMKYCAACGRPLTSFSRTNGNIYTSDNFFMLTLPPIFTICLCKNSDKCYKYHERGKITIDKNTSHKN